MGISVNYEMMEMAVVTLKCDECGAVQKRIRDDKDPYKELGYRNANGKTLCRRCREDGGMKREYLIERVAHMLESTADYLRDNMFDLKRDYGRIKEDIEDALEVFEELGEKDDRGTI